jgi:hypothetical protein
MMSPEEREHRDTDQAPPPSEKTDPRGHAPPPLWVGEPPPANIPGAPSPLNDLLSDIRKEKQAITELVQSVTKLVERSEAAARAIEDTLNHVLTQNARIDRIARAQASSERKIAAIEEQLRELSVRAGISKRPSWVRRLFGAREIEQ